MPLVKIELQKGNSKEFLVSFMNTTMDCIQTVLKLPANDRNIRLSEFDSHLFTMKPPYKYIIEISLFSGRTIDTKRTLYSFLSETLVNKLEINKNELFMLLNEQPKDNWGIRGGVPASDIALGFKVEV
jgi:phenylpyruvate tautomerase PptA (4-oxalocrotonate tautomerase family)